MEQKYMIVDIDRCWGCKSCSVACKQEHDIPSGVLSPITVARIETENADEGLACDFVPVACQHCDEPVCIESCPKMAISRDSEDLVQISEELCIGCGKCVSSCPYGAIALRGRDDKKRIAFKCDLCAERRRRGGRTSCEQHCPGGVFRCLDEKEAAAYCSQKKYSYSVGKVIYVSDILSNLDGRTKTAEEI